VIELLVNIGVLVICAGGGGIPIVKRSGGSLIGVEAVIDKDRAGALLAEELQAKAYVILTDVHAVSLNWGKPDERAIRRATPAAIEQFTFASGLMGPKVAAACDFVRKTKGIAAIGALEDAAALLRGEAGTIITMDAATNIYFIHPYRISRVWSISCTINSHNRQHRHLLAKGKQACPRSR